MQCTNCCSGSAWILQITPGRPQISVGRPQIIFPRPQTLLPQNPLKKVRSSNTPTPTPLLIGHKTDSWILLSHLASRSHQGPGLSLTQFVCLHDRREHLNNFFYFHNYSVFLYLPPPPSTQRLQHYLQITCSITIPRPATRTKRYTSFIHHALLNYQ